MTGHPETPSFDAFGDAVASSGCEAAARSGVRSTMLALALFWVAAFALVTGRTYIPVAPAQPSSIDAPAELPAAPRSAAASHRAG